MLSKGLFVRSLGLCGKIMVRLHLHFILHYTGLLSMYLPVADKLGKDWVKFVVTVCNGA